MNPVPPGDDDRLARLLGEAFDAQARAAVGDHASPPAPRFATGPATPTGPTGGTDAARRRARLWAPLAAAAAVIAIVAAALGISGAFGGTDDAPVAGPPGTASTAPPTAPSSASSLPRAPASATQVRIRSLNADGVTYGVGMPVIAYFSKKFTDARALQAATTATVDGRAIAGAWYFESSSADPKFPVEGHFRPQDYWPAHADVRVTIPVKGISAGRGFGFGNDLTLDFRTGARQIATVDETTHRLSLTTDGRANGTYPVSLGSDATPTSRGIKVIMEKGRSISMRGPGYYDPSVKFTQRLTYSGEYLHAAPWNTRNITDGVDSSNGCTNLLDGDAKKLYGLLSVGDVVTYPNATGPQMQLGQGFGDWNVPWSEWRTGGLIPTR